MNKQTLIVLVTTSFLAAVSLLAAVSFQPAAKSQTSEALEDRFYNLDSTHTILETSEAADKQTIKHNVAFYTATDDARGPVVSIHPGVKAVQVDVLAPELENDALHASATIDGQRLLRVQLLNTTNVPIQYGLQIGRQQADIEIPANSAQIVQVQLPVN